MIFSFSLGESRTVLATIVRLLEVLIVLTLELLACMREPGPVVPDWLEIVLLSQASCGVCDRAVTPVTDAMPRTVDFATGSSLALSRTRRSIGIGCEVAKG